MTGDEERQYYGGRDERRDKREMPRANPDVHENRRDAAQRSDRLGFARRAQRGAA